MPRRWAFRKEANYNLHNLAKLLLQMTGKSEQLQAEGICTYFSPNLYFFGTSLYYYVINFKLGFLLTKVFIFFPARHQSLCSDHYYILRRSRKELPGNVSQQNSSTSLCRVFRLEDSVSTAVQHSWCVNPLQERVTGCCCQCMSPFRDKLQWHLCQ